MNETVASSDPWKVQCYEEVYSLLIAKLNFVDPESNFTNLDELDQFNQLIEVLKYAIENQLHSNKVKKL